MDTFETFDRDALAALQAQQLPKMHALDILRRVDPEGPPDAETHAMLVTAEAYLGHFVNPPVRGRCICCGETLTSGKDMFNLLGTFTWGLANGEGHCGRCLYPARAHHKIDGVGHLNNFVLQYHPDDLSFSERTPED